MENSNQQAIGIIKEVHGPVVVINCNKLPPIRQALSGSLNYETFFF